ncbi:hypothetical protein AVEN_66353-1 [Araneus ventricosus]|uniref:Uncharacterized protein n=1 Tax=Araneus ventricosus TaxID=182803 RepID=A0A4Y2PB00_ARAVE|nr:hypothetical protein AVEN_66353-1 [Araneus ventricosus]
MEKGTGRSYHYTKIRYIACQWCNNLLEGSQGIDMKVSASGLQGPRFEAHQHQKSDAYIVLMDIKYDVEVKPSPADITRKFCKGVPAQVSPSSSDHGSK